MNVAIASTISPWVVSVEVPHFPSLQDNVTADVCVVGSGMAGICTAYLLHRAGQRVVLVTDDELGHGETARTTSHLTSILDTRYFELEELHGEDATRRVVTSHATAIDRIEEIVRNERIDCDFQRLEGYLFRGEGQSAEEMDREFEATRRLGLVVERLAECPIPSLAGPCLQFSQQAQFHPLKFVTGLAKAIDATGGKIFVRTHVDQIFGGENSHVIAANGAMVTAANLVIATDTPVGNLVTIHTKQAPYRTYVIGAVVPTRSVPHGLYWDTLDPYHYIRVHNIATEDGRGRDILIVGGEDHKTGQLDEAEDRYARLEAWTRQRFPIAGEIEFQWSGQIIEPDDGLAYIGLNPGNDNVWIVTGTSGNGMTYGMVAGILLSDQILGRGNDWVDVYRPARVTVGAARDYLRENLNVAVKYGDWLTPGEVSSVEQIMPGEGAVMRHGLQKVAIYRDEQGHLHRYSAVCRHLDCIVAWNPIEHSWDCPCHGSRYDRYGKVINGPSVKDLRPLEES